MNRNLDLKIIIHYHVVLGKEAVPKNRSESLTSTALLSLPKVSPVNNVATTIIFLTNEQ